MNSGVYKITNLINGKFYIGSAANGFKQRWQKHISDLKLNKHCNFKLQKSYKKHGKDAFKFEIVAKCPKEYVIKLEQWFIDNLKPYYNIAITAGSSLGIKRTDEYKAKVSKSRMGFKPTKEFCDNQSKRMIGNSITKGIKLSDERVEAMRQASKGKKHSQETKDKIAASNTGKKLSDESKIKIRNARTKFIYKIKNTMTGEMIECNNLRIFAKENNLHDCHLFETLIGKNGQGRSVNQHKGFKVLSQDLNININ